MPLLALTPDEIQELHEGGELTYNKIFRHLYSQLVVYGRQLTGSLEEGKDLVQEAFAKFWVNKEKLDSYLKIRSYLFTTIMNAHLNIVRRKQVIRKWLFFETRIENNVEPNTISIFFQREVYAEIEKLPNQQKQIIKLAIDGFRNQEIAEKLAISPNQVAVQKAAAIKLVKFGLINKGYIITALLVSLFFLKDFFSKAFTFFK